MIPTAPSNHAFVLIDKMYVDEIKAGNGTKLFLDSSFNPEWNATISGHVVSTPHKLTFDLVNYERKGLRVDDLKPGDEAIFKYLVVEDKDWSDDPEKFFPIESENPRIMEFVNGKRDVVRVYAINRQMWAGAWLDEKGDVKDGIQASRKEVERWASRFSMLGDGELSYKNLMIFEGVMYWKVDYSLLIGYIREGKLFAGRGYVFVEPIEIDLGDMTAGGIVIPEYMQKQKSRRMGIVRHIGAQRDGAHRVTVEEGDHIVWDERFGEQYEILGIPWLVLKHEHILGKLK